MKKTFDLKKLTLIAGLAGVSCLVPQLLLAKASGPCVDCHTMHNSQDGSAVDSNGPNGALTNKSGCIGCHTGSTDSGDNIPYVYDDTGAPGYMQYGNVAGNSLAGGNFYWVINDHQSKGHNVDATGFVADGNLTVPPGFSDQFTTNDDVVAGAATWSSGTQVSCAGTYGCHGKHEDPVGTAIDDFTAISGAHHADDSSIDGSTVGKSYRFLYGIKGDEDPDWEFNASSTKHNQYYGLHRTSDDPTGLTGNSTATISYLCAECHGNFHSSLDTSGDVGIDVDGSFGAAWMRHPTDLDMNTLDATKEYDEYPDDGSVGTYNLMAPVASSTQDTLDGAVLQGSGDAVVMCLSCHRAHGSPYADILRWDYSTCNAASGDLGTGPSNPATQCGCFACHNTKDDV